MWMYLAPSGPNLSPWRATVDRFELTFVFNLVFLTTCPLFEMIAEIPLLDDKAKNLLFSTGFGGIRSGFDIET